MKQTSKVALCGILSALSLLLMVMTIVPVATYALPAMAGAVLIPVVMEAGVKWGWLSYAAVGLLSFLVAPDPEAKVLFLTFFGYYPVLKCLLERMKKRWAEWLIKLILFNGSMAGSYWLTIFVFHLPSDFQLFGVSLPLIFLLIGNVVFVIYDLALTNVLTAYWYRLHPRLSRIFRH
ncbi:MAG: hypothetical protein HFJ80_05820 [Clostridiales bacterium]|nr:hypothetical protein [Clostridiales bacterium]